MKWYISVILSLCLVLGASVSRGDWMLQIHKGATVEEHALADIDIHGNVMEWCRTAP
jgi:hypothetical protein